MNNKLSRRGFLAFVLGAVTALFVSQIPGARAFEPARKETSYSNSTYGGR
jgi:hypothetical protein